MAYIPPLLEEPPSYAPTRKGKGMGEGPHIGQILVIAVVVGLTPGSEAPRVKRGGSWFLR